MVELMVNTLVLVLWRYQEYLQRRMMSLFVPADLDACAMRLAPLVAITVAGEQVVPVTLVRR